MTYDPTYINGMINNKLNPEHLWGTIMILGGRDH